ncbi:MULTISPECIES: hypothetical protein [unclassified Flavobacterium]|uniref:hypothetical protein n=1 Tax=unclassified Flavobacterium TaxID=196869 RepID=UPI0036146D59
MKSDFYIKIENCAAYRKDREKNRNLALRNPDYLKEVTEVAFDLNDKNHHKAFWILELVCEKKLKAFLPYIEQFLETIPNLRNDSAIRPAAKICLFLAKSNHRANGISLSQLQETQIIEMCLDWLIRDEKVATKAYAIKTLFVLGKKYDWVHEELKTIVQQDYAHHTAAYKATARNTLKKIK